jgi:hypothetical protein
MTDSAQDDGFEELTLGFDWRFAVLPQLCDLIKNALGHFPLGGFGDFDHFFASDDGHGIAVGIEADAFTRNVVDHDCVEVLRNQLLAGVFEDVFGLCREANNDLRPLLLRKLF